MKAWAIEMGHRGHTRLRESSNGVPWLFATRKDARRHKEVYGLKGDIWPHRVVRVTITEETSQEAEAK